MQRLYPGQMEMDATGRLRAPEYDMTREQFDAAQAEMNADFEEAKAEAEEELNEGLPPDKYIDIEQFVVAGDPIGVKVLYPNGDIRPESLETYELDIPENIEPQKKPEYVYVWTTGSENPCDICEMMDGTILDDNHVPKPHPNCNCFATKMKKDDFEKKYGDVDAGKQEKLKELYAQEKEWQMKAEARENNNGKLREISDKGMEFLKKMEGDVKVNGRHVIYNDATGLPIKEGEPLPKGATIGYGHLVKKGEDFSKGLSEQEATELFAKDLQDTYKTIERQINSEALYSMSQNNYDALVSFVFNIGPGSAKLENANRGLYQSTVRKYINNGSNHKSDTYHNLESAWRAFRNGGELDNRRDAEWRLFQNSDYTGYR